VLGAAYMLWLYQRTMFGACENPKNQVLKDLNWREIMTLVPLIVWAFWIGVSPKPFFNVLDKPVTAIVQRVNPDFYRSSSAKIAPPTQGVTRPLLAVQAARAKAATAQARVPVLPGSGGAGSQ